MASGSGNIGCVGGAAIFILAALIWQDVQPEKPPEPPNLHLQRKLDELAVQRSVKAILRDPDSAVFKHVTLRCGYVNAKNGFGGYTGYTRFMANLDADAVIETESNHPSFDKIWRKSC